MRRGTEALITPEEIRRIARARGLAVGVVEKDYALSWLLRGLYKENSGVKDSFILKGGTAIRKVYFPTTWRFSEDLDFTVIANKDVKKIRESMQSVFERARLESGINYSMESFHSTAGAIIANAQFIGPLNFANRIRHDITLKEKMVLKPEMRIIKNDFPDLPSFKASAYSLVEILVEKIRSIMQRGYSRDYYDVWRLLKEREFKNSEIKRFLIQKCELNGISYRPESIFQDRRLNEARSFWVEGLGYLTRELPRFDTVISEMQEKLDFLQ